MLALILAALLQAAAAPATEVRRYPAAEATQGVAVDQRHFYAVANSEIGKYDKATGAKVATWRGEAEKFPHLNSCVAMKGELVCASSNYPAVPMTSSVEVFDAARMAHKRSIPVGEGIGSLTWVVWRDGAWWACFAHYDGRGGEPGRDHRETVLVKFGADWTRQAAWRFPDEVLARFAPRSSSGGLWGAEGRLYVTGHDAAEVYVLQLPKAGEVLEHIATIPAPIHGQAIALEPNGRRFFGISRQAREVIAFELPGAR